MAQDCELEGSIDDLASCEPDDDDRDDDHGEDSESAARTEVTPPRSDWILRVHLLDVGAGACQLIEPQDDRCPVTVVDCGTKGNEFAMRRAEVLRYVDEVTKDRDVRIVVSHPDVDHYSYLGEIAARAGNRGHLTHIWYGGSKAAYEKKVPVASFSHGKRNKTFADILARPGDFFGLRRETVRGYERAPIRADTTIGGNDAYALLDCGSIEASAIAVNAGNSPNSKSLVVALQAASSSAEPGAPPGFGVVLAADATGQVQRVITGRACAQKRCPGGSGTARSFFDRGFPTRLVLTASHHGATTVGSNNARWGKYWRDQVGEGLSVIYSAGTMGDGSGPEMQYGHPMRRAVSTYFPRVDDRSGDRGHEIVVCGSRQGKVRICENIRTRSPAYLTATNGTIVVQWDGEHAQTRCVVPDRPRGPTPAHLRSGCSGSEPPDGDGHDSTQPPPSPATRYRRTAMRPG